MALFEYWLNKRNKK
ncbi:TPA: hypothetical protein ACNHTJ_002191 [Enterococcus faecalis]